MNLERGSCVEPALASLVSSGEADVPAGSSVGIGFLTMAGKKTTIYLDLLLVIVGSTLKHRQVNRNGRNLLSYSGKSMLSLYNVRLVLTNNLLLKAEAD